MSIKIQCPGCEKKLTSKDELAGKRVKCPACGQAVLVPAAQPKVIRPTQGMPPIPKEAEVTEINANSSGVKVQAPATIAETRVSKTVDGKVNLLTGVVGLVFVVLGWTLRLIHMTILSQATARFDHNRTSRHLELVYSSPMMILVGVSYVLLLVGGVLSLVGTVSGSGRIAGVVGGLMVALFLLFVFPVPWLVRTR